MPPTTIEEVQRQIAVQLTGQTPEVQRLVLDCATLGFEAGYNACQRDIQQVGVSLGRAASAYKN